MSFIAEKELIKIKYFYVICQHVTKLKLSFNASYIILQAITHFQFTKQEPLPTICETFGFWGIPIEKHWIKKLCSLYVHIYIFMINWLIDFNGMSICQGIFYALRLRNQIHCLFIFTFFVSLFLKSFFFLFCSQFCGIQIIFKQI